MPEAAIRSGIPEFFQLPDVLNQSENNLLVQEINTDCKNLNTLKSVPVYLTNTKKVWNYHGLYFEEDKNQPDELRVLFRYNYNQHGQPERHDSQIFSFNQKTDNIDWGVLKINGRYTYYSGQFYRQHIFNTLSVKNIHQTPKNIFFTTQPKRIQDFFAHLF